MIWSTKDNIIFDPAYTEVIASVKVASTGKWETFAEFEGTEVELTAGTHTFKVYADGGRYSLNWYKLTKIS